MNEMNEKYNDAINNPTHRRTFKMKKVKRKKDDSKKEEAKV